MSSYIALARKWRPAQFSDIIGQSHIVRTLMNAIKAQRIHPAYLFTGSRGIGKTSIARIFAKNLRCESVRWENDWIVSCDVCSNCREIAAGNSVDVIEIDGASNNGVDAVREIRENAKYLPTSGNRKIYIIDEVHMLTTAAFNALLKTLEEPPPHVFFVFATTEPHKIPGTILSRCLRFDYRRVTSSQIHQRLEQVIRSESIAADPASLALIARSAEGSMRDALSLLDQVIAYSGGKTIETDLVRECIGLIESQTLFHILRAVLSKNPYDALSWVHQCHLSGHDLKVLAQSLIEFLHSVILAKTGASRSLVVEVPEEEWNEFQSLASLRPLEELEMIFQVLHHGFDWIARSPQPKIVLDILLIKCAAAETLVYTDAPHQPLTSQKTSSSTEPISTPPKKTPPEIASPSKPANSLETKSEKDWGGFIHHVKTTRPLLASLLEQGIGQLSGQELTLYFPTKNPHHRDQLKSKNYQEPLLLLAREYFQIPIKIQIELKDNIESPAKLREKEKQEKEALIIQQAQSHPTILEAKSLFGGELGPIELQERSHDDSKS